MKTYLKLILGASLFAYFFYRDIKKEVNALTNKEETLYLFQVGVFQNPANAENYATNFDSSGIYKTDDLYRVITCATASSQNKDKLYNYYKKANINFYIKEVALSKKVKNQISKAETILAKTTKKSAINEVCQNLIDNFLLYS